jgi:aspartyl protease family protein
MRNLMIFAAVMIGLGSLMAQMADRMTAASASPSAAGTSPARTIVAPEPVSQVGPHSLSLAPDSRGHFLTEARINGQQVNFMVDTGASVVAVNESSAARFGVYPSRGDFTADVTTANGAIKGARTRLAMVDVGGLVLRDVDALVLPDEALSENLLGLSFLSRLKRFEYSNGQMVLQQ